MKQNPWPGLNCLKAEIRALIIKMVSLICIIFLLVWITGTSCFSASKCDRVTLGFISDHIPLPKDVSVVFKQEKDHFCEVILKINNSLVPVYCTETSVLAGQLFHNKTSMTQKTLNSIPELIEKERQQSLNELALKREKTIKLLKQNVKALDNLVSISFKPETFKTHIYVISDPGCSHCKNLLTQLWPAAVKSNTEIRLIIFPMGKAESLAMAATAICKEYSFQDYIHIKQGDTAAPVCALADQMIPETIRFFQSAGLFFVPVVLAGDGSWVVDTSDINRVRFHLGIEPVDNDTPDDVCRSDNFDQGL